MMPVPAGPSNVSIDANMRIAYGRMERFSRGGGAFLYSWFYSQVRNRGPWDFKQMGGHYESFGNFHYGAVGTASGMPAHVLLRAAGAAQVAAGTSRTEFGTWWGGPPYGDDYRDQYWIKEGIEYAKSQGY